MASYSKECWLVVSGFNISLLSFDSKESAEEFIEQHYPKGMGFHAVKATITWEEENE